MKNILIFTIVIIFNYLTIVKSESSNYIISILRKKSDNNYDDETPKIQMKIDELVNDRMNDIYDVIIEYKKTYKLKNGKMDERLKELNSLPLLFKRQEEQKKVKLIFKNKVRGDSRLEKRALNLNNSNNSTIEYIPFESDLIQHVCPIMNYYAVSAYLSDKTAEIVCKMDNVINCEKSKLIQFQRSIENEEQTNNNNNNKKNTTSNSNNNNVKTNTTNEKVNKENNDNVGNKYYDIEAIKKETKWKEVSVQEFPYADNHLALLSQSPFIENNSTMDKNFYYPSSAGQGIDIYFIDNGIDVNHEDYDTYKGTPYERTVTCDAVASMDDFHVNEGEEKKKCNLSKNEVPNHGIMVASVAGGKIFGVSKKANLHMISVDATMESILKGLDYISQKAVPHKTVISLSYGGDRYSVVEYNKLKELIQKNFIIIAASGNENEYCCNDMFNKPFHSMAGYRLVIVAGGTNLKIENNGYTKSDLSNYGDCVDIHGPGYVSYPDVTNKTDYKISYGTSCSTPLIAGVAASIMSEHPEIQYDNELMRKTLIEMSIKDVITDLRLKGSTDTPNRFVNNGKRSIYSVNNSKVQCGIVNGNTTVSCSDGGCCSKEGLCISPKEDPLKKCLLENGCQSEFGYCTSKDKSIEECQKELKANEECQIEISSKMDKRELLQKCKTFKSSKCDDFYKLQYSEKSVCSIARKNKNVTLGFLDNFNREKYYQSVDICNKTLDDLKEECSHGLEQYKKCFIENLYYLGNTDLNHLLEECKAYDYDKCTKFYENVSEIINGVDSCATLKEVYSMDYFANNIIYTEKYMENNDYLNNVYCKSVTGCDKELKEYNECKIDINNYMETEEILSHCHIFNSEKCQKAFSLANDEKSSCHLLSTNFDIDYGFSVSKHKKFTQVCEENFDDNKSMCQDDLEYYNKCYEKDLKSLYSENPNSKTISQICSDLNSEECTTFFKEPGEIINKSNSCSMLSKIYSNDYIFKNIMNKNMTVLQEEYNSYSDICKNVTSKDTYHNELCKDELSQYKKCQVTISSDLEDKKLLGNCLTLTSFHCINYYNTLLEDKSSCSSVKDQYEFMKNFNKNIYDQYKSICNEIYYRFIDECRENLSEYGECYDDSLEKLKENNRYSSEFNQRCIDLQHGKCHHFFNNTNDIINSKPSCATFRNAFVEQRGEEEGDEGFYVEIFDIVPNVINSNYEGYLNICKDVKGDENYYKETCEKELTVYKRCQIEISSDTKEEELLTQCHTFKDDYCDSFYKSIYTQSSICYAIEDKDRSEYLNHFTEEKYKEYNNTCTLLIEKYNQECKAGIAKYTKCFETSIEDLYDEDPESKELKQGCQDLTSKECVTFYNNPKSILKDVPACVTYSKYTSPEYVIENIVKKDIKSIEKSYKKYTNTCNKLKS